MRVGVSGTLARLGAQSGKVRVLILGYGLAVASVAVALGLALTLQYYEFRDVELPVLTMAIAITTWYAGVGPSVLAIALSALCFNYFFVEPIYSFYVSVRDAPYFMVFIVWAVILASFAAVRRRIEDNVRYRDPLLPCMNACISSGVRVPSLSASIALKIFS